MDSDARRAARTLLLSATLFAVMALAAKRAARHIPGPEIAFVRFVTGAVVVAALAVTRRISLRPRNLGWLFVRGACGGCAVLLYFWCIEKVGVGIASLLNYTAPAWSLLFGWWLLGERPRRATFGALALTTSGVVLVVGPGTVSSLTGVWPTLGLFSAVLSAMALTATRAVRRVSPSGGSSPEGSWTVFASFTVFGMVATGPFSFPPLGRWIVPTGDDAVALLATAAASVAAQILMTSALKHVTAATTGIIHQLTVVLSLTGGVLLYGERLSTPAIVGAALTIGGVVAALAVAAATRVSGSG